MLEEGGGSGIEGVPIVKSSSDEGLCDDSTGVCYNPSEDLTEHSEGVEACGSNRLTESPLSRSDAKVGGVASPRVEGHQMSSDGEGGPPKRSLVFSVLSLRQLVLIYSTTSVMVFWKLALVVSVSLARESMGWVSVYEIMLRSRLRMMGANGDMQRLNSVALRKEPWGTFKDA